MLIGYARVSTTDQDTALQIDALTKAGVDRIYQEHASGVAARPQLERCLSELQSGDELVVWKLDRIARSLRDLLRVIERIHEVGARIRSLNEPLDTASPLGVFLLQILGAVAELERRMIRERAIAGMVSAYRRGLPLGGRKTQLITGELAQEVKKRYELGESMSSIARSIGVSPTTVRDFLKGRPHRQKMPVISKYLQHFPDAENA